MLQKMKTKMKTKMIINILKTVTAVGGEIWEI